MAALTAVCSQIQIPLPYVPINLALLAVHLAGALLGAKYGTFSLVIYVALAAVGVPVLAGFSGGIPILLGMTGGYVFGYVLCAFLDGFILKKWGCTFLHCCVAMVAGLAVCYLFGTAWFMIYTGYDLVTSLMVCVLPFLPGDAVKIAVAAFVTVKLRPVMISNGWISR